MSNDMLVLYGLAVTIGFTHTLFGPDHYVPFIMMSTARKWSSTRTLAVTLLCGLGHVGSSVVLGLIGVAAGIAVGRLEAFEGIRGNLAAWAIIAFGLVYCVWGIRQAYRNRPHQHPHFHADGHSHTHEHVHSGEHAHVHDEKHAGTLNAQKADAHAIQSKASITPWALFVLFVLGPCEPLIPLLMYPAARESVWGMVAVAILFGGVTITTMAAVVLLGTLGVNFLPLRKLERYMHAIAGGTICLSGLAIVFLGL